MNARDQRAPRDFVKSLTGADFTEIQGYFHEIASNQDFHRQLEANQVKYGSRRFSYWGVGATPGAVLYALCRQLRPGAVVETGVASGFSSAYILCSLEENRHGRLYSIDLPWHEHQSGWVIPEYLRHRWQLLEGRSADKMPGLLEKLGTIDIFFHDSDHSYQNMLREFQTAWAHLRVGGVLLAHNIDYNDAFADFCRSVRQRGQVLGGLGGIARA